MQVGRMQVPPFSTSPFTDHKISNARANTPTRTTMLPKSHAAVASASYLPPVGHMCPQIRIAQNSELVQVGERVEGIDSRLQARRSD
jgi:hypothetical protein